MATRVLITGASGLIGAHLLAQAGHSDLNFIPLARTDFDLLSENTPDVIIHQYQPDVIVHLAWSASGTANYRDSDLNAKWVAATVRLVEAATHHGVHLFCTGTAVDQAPGTDAYARAKAELRATLRSRVESREVTWIRPFYVFDPAARRPDVVRRAQAAVRDLAPVGLRTPHAVHDFVHADDVGRAIAAAVAAELTGFIDVGSGTLRSVADLVTACGATWTTVEQTLQAPSHSQNPADAAALRAIGWQPEATTFFFQTSQTGQPNADDPQGS